MPVEEDSEKILGISDSQVLVGAIIPALRRQSLADLCDCVPRQSGVHRETLS